MSRGALIFAYDSAFSYAAMARANAKLIKKYLDIPVTLVTNGEDVDVSAFDSVIIQPLLGPSGDRHFMIGKETKKIPWHNSNRSSAYDLSPYDQTLLVDADYLIMDSELAKLFDTNIEFACYDSVHDISGWDGLQLGARVGNPGIPMQWATVVYFTKTQMAKSIFDYMTLIKQNYQYYSSVFNFEPHLFRNDFVLSIALQTLHGYSIRDFTAIQGKLITANQSMDILEVRPNGEIVFTWQYGNHPRLVTKLKNTNVHVMNKVTLSNPVILSQLEALAA